GGGKGGGGERQRRGGVEGSLGSGGSRPAGSGAAAVEGDRGRRAPGNLVCFRRDLLGGRRAAMLESQHHQRDRSDAEEGGARGEGVAAPDAVRRKPRHV